jgi:hypothetical protein
MHDESFGTHQLLGGLLARLSESQALKLSGLPRTHDRGRYVRLIIHGIGHRVASK